MRKILKFPRNGIAIAKAVVRRAKLFAIGACIAVTTCAALPARAQTMAEYLAPAATNAKANAQRGPLSMQQGGSVFGGQNNAQAGAVTTAMALGMEGLPTVDATYSVLNDDTKVVQAQGSAFIPGPRNDFDPCTAGCDVSWYFGVEALYFKRESDNNFSLSRNVFMPTWDYEPAARITLGRLFDCTNGWEFVYAGEFNWERGIGINDPGGNLQSTFFPTAGYGPAEISSFNNANVHIQSYRAKLNSVEINRRWWVWDVISTAIGVRYVEYDEEYAFFSQSGANVGTFQSRAENQLLGLQLGADLIYPVALRGNVGFRLKGGAYGNFAGSGQRLENAGVLVINAGDERTDFAGFFEYGVFANYAIVPSIRLSCGYEFWWLPGTSTIPEQAPQIVFPGSGTYTQVEDNLYWHGGNIGIELLF